MHGTARAEIVPLNLFNLEKGGIEGLSYANSLIVTVCAYCKVANSDHSQADGEVKKFLFVSLQMVNPLKR